MPAFDMSEALRTLFHNRRQRDLDTAVLRATARRIV